MLFLIMQNNLAAAILCINSPVKDNGRLKETNTLSALRGERPFCFWGMGMVLDICVCVCVSVYVCMCVCGRAEGVLINICGEDS